MQFRVSPSNFFHSNLGKHIALFNLTIPVLIVSFSNFFSVSVLNLRLVVLSNCIAFSDCTLTFCCSILFSPVLGQACVVVPVPFPSFQSPASAFLFHISVVVVLLPCPFLSDVFCLFACLFSTSILR